MQVFDKYTGKQLDKPSDTLSSPLTETCETCGTQLINRCMVCGAPVCCPKCCKEAAKVESVALALDESLAVLERAVAQLRRQLVTLRATSDLDVASESAALIARLPADAQLGRVVARLVRNRN